MEQDVCLIIANMEVGDNHSAKDRFSVAEYHFSQRFFRGGTVARSTGVAVFYRYCTKYRLEYMLLHCSNGMDKCIHATVWVGEIYVARGLSRFNDKLAELK